MGRCTSWYVRRIDRATKTTIELFVICILDLYFSQGSMSAFLAADVSDEGGEEGVEDEDEDDEDEEGEWETDVSDQHLFIEM